MHVIGLVVERNIIIHVYTSVAAIPDRYLIVMLVEIWAGN
jgi:hypothetical protein